MNEREKLIKRWLEEAKWEFRYRVEVLAHAVYFESDGLSSRFRCGACDWTAPGNEGGKALIHEGEHAVVPWIRPWELDPDFAAVLTDAITSWF